MSDKRRRSSAIRRAVCISAIAKATSMSCSARRSKSALIFYCEPVSTRLAQDGSCTVSAMMKQVRVKGLHRVWVKDRKGNWSEAVLEIKYRRLRVLPPVAKQKQCPALLLTVIWAQE